MIYHECMFLLYVCVIAPRVQKGFFTLASPMLALRSSAWSSETLVEGMKHVTSQPSEFLAKQEDEPDNDLVNEFQVSYALL